MRRLLCLLLILAACKSSTKTEQKEKKDRLSVVTTYVLEGSTNDNVFHRERFHGDIDHIAETARRETHMSDSYVRKDTVLRHYIFREGHLYQVAGRSRRMQPDTMTMRYDTAGRILARVYSDEREMYYANVYAYNHAGRLSKIVHRLFSIVDSTLYRYNTAGDTISADGPVTKKKISIRARGDEMIVQHYMVDEAVMRLGDVETYNGNGLQTSLSHYADGQLFYKVFRKYDKYDNPVSLEYHKADYTAKDSVAGADPSRSYKIAYKYDNEGNWTSKVQTWYDTSKIIITERKITYR